jgi:hypothetical protein
VENSKKHHFQISNKKHPKMGFKTSPIYVFPLVRVNKYVEYIGILNESEI